jgi:hypothetical protein
MIDEDTKCGQKKCPKKCSISTNGYYCDALKFKIEGNNLPYEECENFPSLIKKFIKSVTLITLIKIAQTIPEGDDRAAAINANYVAYENFIYKGFTYNIRLTLTESDGKVIYDSSSGTTDAAVDLLQLHTTRMEIQRATEKTWGLMKRTSNTTQQSSQYASIWIPNIRLLNSITDINTNTGVLNFRFAYKVDDLGNPLPITTV